MGGVPRLLREVGPVPMQMRACAPIVVSKEAARLERVR